MGSPTAIVVSEIAETLLRQTTYASKPNNRSNTFAKMTIGRAIV